MICHSQSRQCSLIPILLDPVHVGLQCKTVFNTPQKTTTTKKLFDSFLILDKFDSLLFSSFWNRIHEPSQISCANLVAAFGSWQNINRQKLLGDVLSIPGLLCNLWLFAWCKEWDVVKGGPFQATCCVFKALREERPIFYSSFPACGCWIGRIYGR